MEWGMGKWGCRVWSGQHVLCIVHAFCGAEREAMVHGAYHAKHCCSVNTSVEW